MTIQNDCLAALDAHEKGDWERAHSLVQQHEGSMFPDWIHAMLHRDEGGMGNASYWYRRAGKSMPSQSVDEERETIRSAITDRPE